MPSAVLVLISGLLLSFAWPVRGQFGHEWGALIPGALAAFAAASLRPSAVWRNSFAPAVVFGSLGFSIGGAFGYGSLVTTIINSPYLYDVLPQLLHVFLIGAVWGGLGMALLGFGFERTEALIRDITIVLAAVLCAWAAVNLLHAGGREYYWFAGSLALISLYNLFLKKSGLITIFTVYGFLGFGAGFLIAVIILWAGTQGHLEGSWWQLRDQIWGFIGGISVMTAVYRACSKGETPQPVPAVWFSKLAFIFYASVITGINLWNTCEKWFQSATPPHFQTAAWVISAAGLIVILTAAVLFLTRKDDFFREPLLNTVLLWSTLFFCEYTGLLAIAKSIIYTGWSAWETAFTLFLIDLVLFAVVLPLVLKTKKIAAA